MRFAIALVLCGVAGCGGSLAVGASGDGGASSNNAAAGDAAGGDATTSEGDASEEQATLCSNADPSCPGIDAGATDATTGADGAPNLDADVEAEADVPPFVDAGCIDGGLPPDLGSPFACGTGTCFTRSGYCLLVRGGAPRRARNAPPPTPLDPFVGGTCTPLPCSCGANPSCACVRTAFPAGCPCVEQDGGAIGVECDLP